jgi:YbbR domain-containing protein
MSFARDFLLRNWAIKLTSVLLAFLLWLAVRGEPPAERVLTVPLEIIIPTNMQITGERPGTVEVTLRGSANAMWFGQPFPSCRVDLGDATEGVHEVPLTPADVRVPSASGIEVLSVRPARIQLTLEKITTRAVPVRVVRGEPPLDLEVYSVKVDPPRVTITGPRSHVDKIREIPTENISLSGQRESLRTYARLDIPDAAVHAVPAGPVQVTIQLGVRRQLQTVRYVRVVPDNPSVAVVPSRISLRVLAPVTLEKKLTAADFAATVSTAGLGPTQQSMRVKPEVKHQGTPIPGLAIMEITPPEVTIRMEGRK